jgi:hypothetical protein
LKWKRSPKFLTRKSLSLIVLYGYTALFSTIKNINIIC